MLTQLAWLRIAVDQCTNACLIRISTISKSAEKPYTKSSKKRRIENWLSLHSNRALIGSPKRAQSEASVAAKLASLNESKCSLSARKLS